MDGASEPLLATPEFLLEGALFSSEPNIGPSLRTIEQAGAIPIVVKSLNYELRHSVASASTESVFARLRPGLLSLPDPEALPASSPVRVA